MILTCPSCGTRYRADPANFSAPGRNVRCAKCGHVWFQAAPEPEPEVVSAPVLLITAQDAGSVGGPTLGDQVTKRKSAAGWRSSAAADTARNAMRNRIIQAGGVILLLILLAGIGWAAIHYRQGIVRLWPDSSRLYTLIGFPVNLTGIAIRSVGLRQEVQGGVPILSVTGKLVNVSTQDQAIPHLRVVLLDGSRRELYRWTFDPGVESLPPGTERDFDTTLSSPPPDARAVDVSFAGDDAR
jgi:predicted Zn finger-like uncharacterized protein